MEDLLDTLLFDDELSSEEREALQDRLEENPDLADAWAHWTEVRAALRTRLEEDVPDRELLVLYVLHEEGYEEALTETEREALDASRADIARALDEQPALERVVERIRAECIDFEDVWTTHFGDEGPAGAASPEPSDAARERPDRARSDRAPRAPESQDESSSRWTRRFALASLIVGIAVGALLFWPQGSSSTTVTVDEGERRVVDLGDGSTVRLVGAATFAYPESFADNEPRRVRLKEGRAFFDVQHRTDSTAFVVSTPTATTTVLGTQFGVTTTVDTTEVVLASGSVQVEAADQKEASRVVLEPGQKSWVATGAAPAAPTPADLTTALEWTGLFVFRSVPMETVATRLNRRYDVTVSVAPALATEPVTGTFERDQPVQQVLDALAATLEAKVERTDDTYRLVPR